MLDFIMIPAMFGLVTYGVYSIFALFVRKKERLILIEKLGEKIPPELLEDKFKLPDLSVNSFGTMRAAFLFLGLGAGLLAGWALEKTYDAHDWDERSVIYGSSVLLTAGLMLLISFLIEYNLTKKK